MLRETCDALLCSAERTLSAVEASHGTMVARELGVLAVVGIPGITSSLISGALIEVDGFAGEVYLKNPSILDRRCRP